MRFPVHTCKKTNCVTTHFQKEAHTNGQERVCTKKKKTGTSQKNGSCWVGSDVMMRLDLCVYLYIIYVRAKEALSKKKK